MGVMSTGEGTSTARAGAQHPPETGAGFAHQRPFTTAEVEVAGNTVFVRRSGTGPAMLLVHGFPRTSLMWRFLAPRLAEHHTVICVDLRAYGRSGIPASTDTHFPPSRSLATIAEDASATGWPWTIPSTWSVWRSWM
jgi:pimeloyl-ACP methyl ester carboxylesterase